MGATSTLPRRESAGRPAAPDPPAAPGEGLLSRYRTPLLAYLASRVLVTSVAAVVAVGRSGAGQDPGAGPWPAIRGVHVGVLRVLARWDGAWYAELARHGYPAANDLHHPSRLASAAFFPLYPALVRVVSDVTRLPAVDAGLLVTTVAGVVATIAIWALVRHLSGRAAADRAVLLICLWPGAFVFSMAYSEPLLLAAAAGCLLALHRRQWVLAGLCAAVGTASRPNGAALVLVCAVAALLAIRGDREWRALWSVGLAPVGLVAFASYLWVRAGSPLLWMRAERQGWNDRIDLGKASLWRIYYYARNPLPGLGARALNDLVGVAGLVFLVVALLFLWRWRPPVPVALYGVVAAGMAVVSNHVGPRPRLLLAGFPLVVAVAVGVRGRAYTALVVASGALLVVLSALIFATTAATP